MTEREKYKWNIVGMALSLFLVGMMPALLMGILEIYSEALLIGLCAIFFAVAMYFMVKVLLYQKDKQKRKQEIIDKWREWSMPAILPDTPVTLDENTDFIFPALLNSAPKYFEKAWQSKAQMAMIGVGYEGRCVLQILQLSPEDEFVKDISLNFYPYGLPNSSRLVNRFKSCKYYSDFADLDSEKDNHMIACYGENVMQALKVASYILATVYYIPTSYQLEILEDTY